MYKFFLYIVILVFVNQTFGQSYLASYKCIVNNEVLLQKNNTIDSSAKELLKFVLPQQMVIIYEVVSNKNFAKVKGIINQEDNGNSIPLRETANEFIIDIKNEVAYDVTTKEYFKIVTHKVKDYEVKFSKKIPAYITPFLIFQDAKNGLERLQTPKMSIKLIKYEKVNQKVDYSDLFKKTPPKNTLKEIDFLQ